jgi:hypothetical protein
MLEQILKLEAIGTSEVEILRIFARKHEDVDGWRIEKNIRAK